MINLTEVKIAIITSTGAFLSAISTEATMYYVSGIATGAVVTTVINKVHGTKK